MLEVVSGGLLTTVQDLGRTGFTDLGVPRGGAVDQISLTIANALVANPPGAAALEMTLLGPDLRVLAPLEIAVAGADLGGVVRPGGRRLTPGKAHLLQAGDELAFPGPTALGRGARSYLALAGGIDVPVVLGSRSTCLVGGFGGLDGAPLRPGARLAPLAPGTDRGKATGRLGGRIWPGGPFPAVDRPPGGALIRILAGPHLAGLGRGTMATLCDRTWTVRPESDRMGIRLAGEPILRPPSADLLSLGMSWGSIQVPPDGEPIVLLADHQPTGGYPVAAVAITADLPILGQLAPADRLRFQLTTAAVAREALVAQRQALAESAARLAESDPWTDLASWAGG